MADSVTPAGSRPAQHVEPTDAASPTIRLCTPCRTCMYNAFDVPELQPARARIVRTRCIHSTRPLARAIAVDELKLRAASTSRGPHKSLHAVNNTVWSRALLQFVVGGPRTRRNAATLQPAGPARSRVPGTVS